MVALDATGRFVILAVELAQAGRTVALISSGDSGVYVPVFQANHQMFSAGLNLRV